MPIPRSLSSVKSLFGNLAQTSHYEVQFGGLPSQLSSFLLGKGITPFFTGGDFGLLCFSASLPTSSFATAEVSPYIGLKEKIAHTRIYSNITLEFYVDRDKWDNPFVLEDVPPEQMIAIHLPWHSKARYILDNPDTLEKALSGDFDDLRDDYATAVEYVKRMKKNNLSESEQRWYYGNRQSINKNKIISENEGYKLSQLAKVGINMEDADFWLVRRGSIGDVGQPSRDWNPEDIGIKIVMIRNVYRVLVKHHYVFFIFRVRINSSNFG